MAAALRLVCTDEHGQTKVLDYLGADRLDNPQAQLTWGSPDRQRGIDCCALSQAGDPYDTEHAVLAAGRSDGSVELWQPCTGASLGTIAAPQASSAEQKEGRTLKGLAIIWSSAREPTLISCRRGGTVSTHQRAPPEEGSPAGWVATHSWQADKDVECMAMNEAGTHIALGCCGTSLSLWQLDTRAKVWQAKGPKRNRIGLVDKPWDTAVAFLPGSQGQRLIAGTAFGKLRTFVTNQKRATREVVSEESRVTALAPTADGSPRADPRLSKALARQLLGSVAPDRRERRTPVLAPVAEWGTCWVANGLGTCRALNLKTGRLHAGLKGAHGSLRALAMHPELPLLAAGGLDRHALLFHAGTHKLLGRVYLKQQLTGLAWAPVPAPDAAAEATASSQKEDGQGELAAEGEGQAAQRSDDDDGVAEQALRKAKRARKQEKGRAADGKAPKQRKRPRIRKPAG